MVLYMKPFFVYVDKNHSSVQGSVPHHTAFRPALICAQPRARLTGPLAQELFPCSTDDSSATATLAAAAGAAAVAAAAAAAAAAGGSSSGSGSDGGGCGGGG